VKRILHDVYILYVVHIASDIEVESKWEETFRDAY